MASVVQAPSRVHDEEQGSEEDTKFYKEWTDIAEALREHYQTNAVAMSEELDAFLAFSGIFSAVVALFVGQSATSLQPDNSQLTVAILRTISQQIGDQHAPPVAAMQPFHTSSFDVVLNSLLDASLLTSVTASGLSLWVKQWLREYQLDEPAFPRDRALVRLYRHDGLRTWRVAAIVAFISIVLQLSVLLFSAGVIMLAYKLNVTLARALFALNVAWWAATWATAVCPTFSPSCPYKSPFSRAIFRVSFYCGRIVIRAGDLPHWVGRRWSVGRFRTMAERELDDIQRDGNRAKLALEAVAFANEEFRGSERLKAINECLREWIERILRAHYGMSKSDAFESKTESDLGTEDKGIKRLMRAWCQIFVQDNRPQAASGSERKYQLFYAVSEMMGLGRNRRDVSTERMHVEGA